MREIKFRAWAGGVMVYFGLFDVSDGYYKDSQRQITTMEGLYVNERSPVMQYTGLKDKNGTEIYEGDILQWWNNIGKPQAVEATDGGWNPFIDDCETDGSWHYKVIGNIHENPELLETT